MIDAESARPLRVLVMSHSHPSLTNGGAEVAAFRLFSALNATNDVEAWFLGCDPRNKRRDGVVIAQPFSDREYVYTSSGDFNWFRFANSDPEFPREFERLLAELRPDVIHVHHYVGFGLEALMIAKRVLPASRIVVTLHEYLAICNHFGQMVTRDHFNLCDRSGLEQCHRCFPDIDKSEFFLRAQYVKLFFELVDHFIAPSRFLRERYIDWGIERPRFSVIENIIASASSSKKVHVLPDGSTDVLRIGFFGQISKLKGISVLFACAQQLSDDDERHIVFDIYGDHKGQPKEFQDEFLSQLAQAGPNVRFRGAYRQDQVDDLMCGVDAVLVPSIWWENSPVVIQEARRNGRPVICSDIGGMAEKVRDGVDGFHFAVASSFELSHLLTRLYDDRSLLHAVQQTIQRPPAIEDVASEHLRIYRGVEAGLAS